METCVIVGLGTGRAEDLTLGALEAMQAAGCVVLQTGETPVARALAARGIAFETLDALYETAEDFDALCTQAAAYVLARPGAAFCVLGSVAGSRLAQAVRARAEVRVIEGVSFAANAFAVCGVDACGAQTFAAADLPEARFSTNLPLAVTELDTVWRAADVALALERFYGAECPAWLVRAGQAQALTLWEVPRQKEYTYDTVLVMDKLPLEKKQSYTFDDLVAVIGILRGPEGCPWDREQTHASLRQFLLEECYETLDAIRQKDPYMLADELGDVLLQVVLHARIADEHAEFDATDVTTAICKKMIARHTHIFGTDSIDTADGVIANWEKVKRAEKGQKSHTESLRDIPRSMSPLLRAAKLQKKMALAGFDWEDYTGALEKVKEELGELEAELAAGAPPEGEAGDLLFAVVNLLRKLKVNADVALHNTSEKVIARFAFMEEQAALAGKKLENLSLDGQDALWEQAKMAGL